MINTIKQNIIIYINYVLNILIIMQIILITSNINKLNL